MRIYSKTPAAERFWPKVDRRGPDECWLWRATRLPTGYGKFWTGERLSSAHRVSLEISLGRALGPDAEACHTCDNPPCVNPAHLYEATHAENMADSARRGRTTRGERAPGARLTNAQASEVRRLLVSHRQIELIKRFGVSRSVISRIALGQSYRSAA